MGYLYTSYKYIGIYKTTQKITFKMVKYDCIVCFGRNKTVELIRVPMRILLSEIKKAFLKNLDIDIEITRHVVVNLQSNGKRLTNPILAQMISVKRHYKGMGDG